MKLDENPPILFDDRMRKALALMNKERNERILKFSQKE
jgi:hypothetical protein